MHNNASWQCWEEIEKNKLWNFLFDLVGACFVPFSESFFFFFLLLSLHHHIAANFHRFLLSHFRFLPFGRQKFISGHECSRHTSHGRNISYEKIKVFFLSHREKNITQDEKSTVSAQTLSILFLSLFEASSRARSFDTISFPTFTAFTLWWFFMLSWSLVRFPSAFPRKIEILSDIKNKEKKSSFFAVFLINILSVCTKSAVVWLLRPFMSMSSYKILIKLSFMSLMTSHQVMFSFFY